MRAVLLVLALGLLAGGCSDDKPVVTENRASSAQVLQKDCNSPKWREQNLGLWYSVCRKPMRW